MAPGFAKLHADGQVTEENEMFKINAMDHIVLNVPDIDRSLAFYMDVLGLEPERLDKFRRGEAPFPSVRISAVRKAGLRRGTPLAGVKR